MSFLSQRKKSGLSQVEVAAKLGVTSSAVCLWESGETKPRADTLVKIAFIYGCTIDELLKEDT